MASCDHFYWPIDDTECSNHYFKNLSLKKNTLKSFYDASQHQYLMKFWGKMWFFETQDSMLAMVV